MGPDGLQGIVHGQKHLTPELVGLIFPGGDVNKHLFPQIAREQLQPRSTSLYVQEQAADA